MRGRWWSMVLCYVMLYVCKNEPGDSLKLTCAATASAVVELSTGPTQTPRGYSDPSPSWDTHGQFLSLALAHGHGDGHRHSLTVCSFRLVSRRFAASAASVPHLARPCAAMSASALPRMPRRLLPRAAPCGRVHVRPSPLSILPAPLARPGAIPKSEASRSGGCLPVHPAAFRAQAASHSPVVLVAQLSWQLSWQPSSQPELAAELCAQPISQLSCAQPSSQLSCVHSRSRN